MGERTLWHVTEPSQEARKHLEVPQIDEPSPILRMA